MKKNILVVDDSALMRRVECDITIQTIIFKQRTFAEMVWKHTKK